jgi:DNA-binding Xre family transcriptional regulator
MEQTPIRRAALAGEVLAEIARAQVTKASAAKAAGIHPDTLTRRAKASSHQKFPVEELVAICDFLGIQYADVIERSRVAA